MLKLVPMTQEIYDGYIENLLKDYSQEHIRTGNWKPEEVDAVLIGMSAPRASFPVIAGGIAIGKSISLFAI